MSVGAIQQQPVLRPLSQPSHCEVIKKVALKCLRELVFSLGAILVVGSFVCTPAGVAVLLEAALIQSVVSVILHSLSAWVSQRGFFEFLAGLNFGHFTGYNVQNLLHETGHAAASLLLYNNPRPLIEIYPFEGGVTQYSKTRLSPFGQKIGPAKTTFWLTASGPGLTLLVSSVLLALGVAMRKKHPSLSKYLITWSALDFVNHAYYAYTALRTPAWTLTHDFARLAIFGIHPVAATVSLLALPILIALGMSRLENPGGSVETV